MPPYVKCVDFNRDTHTHARVSYEREHSKPRCDSSDKNAVGKATTKSAPVERNWSTESLTPNTVFTNRIWESINSHCVLSTHTANVHFLFHFTLAVLRAGTRALYVAVVVCASARGFVVKCDVFSLNILYFYFCNDVVLEIRNRQRIACARETTQRSAISAFVCVCVCASKTNVNTKRGEMVLGKSRHHSHRPEASVSSCNFLHFLYARSVGTAQIVKIVNIDEPRASSALPIQAVRHNLW